MGTLVLSDTGPLDGLTQFFSHGLPVPPCVAVRPAPVNPNSGAGVPVAPVGLEEGRPIPGGASARVADAAYAPTAASPSRQCGRTAPLNPLSPQGMSAPTRPVLETAPGSFLGDDDGR